jgi:2-C-methyl-D-erythritol 4-phosphate cytidylyltransferase
MVALAVDDDHWPGLDLASTRVRTTVGGAERCHSVLNALIALSDDAAADDWVLVHDAARPCLRAEDIDQMMVTLGNGADGGILASPVRDTLKRCSVDGAIERTVDRTQLWHALTPQMFRYAALRGALESVLATNTLVTDEAQAIELSGQPLRVIEGHGDNIKITRPEDLVLAALYLRAQGRG